MRPLTTHLSVSAPLPDAQGEVFLQFLLEALVDVARGAESPLSRRKESH